MKVKTKKITQIGFNTVVLLTALNVNAGTIAPTDSPTATTISQTNCSYISTNSPFAFTLSRNVGLAYNCSTTAVAVNTGNTKGKFTYGGSSNGGSVKQCGTTAVSTANGYTVTAPSTSADGCS